jgi:hypothetical protein
MLTEKHHTGGFLISEADGHLSRDNGILVAGQNLQAGTVLGKITTGGKWAFYDNDAGDGTQAAAGILYASVDATSADQPCVVITRDAEVNGKELTWEAGGSPAPDQIAGKADLALLHIIVR